MELFTSTRFDRREMRSCGGLRATLGLAAYGPVPGARTDTDRSPALRHPFRASRL